MINFMKLKYLYFAISLAFIVPGIISLGLYGFKSSIDFTGGSLLEIELKQTKPTPAEITQTLETQAELVSVTPAEGQRFVLKFKPLDRQQALTIKEVLTKKYGEVTEIRFETVGPTIGRELLRKTLTAIVIAAIAILIFVMKQFNQFKYGVCAVLAMFHDTIILLGAFSLLGHFYGVEVDTLFVTAVLTILSFSVHDTIVVYDRIRESLKTNHKAGFTDIVNKAVNETLARSINNSMTIIFMLLALWLLGGESIRWFVFALLIGTITGTYSSTFVAAPLLILWEDLKNRK
ncbi:protein-export membrane protein SecF [Microgenomates group bacterium RIFCSPLOWO2_01_FULL_47_10]|nr:MAG: protein-export membrane protein SecF [Microgenomates group bacterium RIFCSPLOWO2_01_FULL_47_10]